MLLGGAYWRSAFVSDRAAGDGTHSRHRHGDARDADIAQALKRSLRRGQTSLPGWERG
jgi:hypothetical protein